ncbi:hypothetical protein CF161_03693 [Pseudomonas sp. CF161]|nr:hypothetical protein CF161_03693 [Pseudomonas sp. CF161]
MRGGSEQQKMATFVFHQALQQLKTQLLASTTPNAGMCLIDDYTFRSNGKEVFAVSFAFDVVEANYHHRVVVKQANSVWQVALNAASATRGKRHGLQIEAGFQLTLPLFDEVRRTKYSKTADLPTIHQLAGNQAGFDCFADTYVIGNQ